MDQHLKNISRETLVKILGVKESLIPRMSHLILSQLHHGILTDEIHAEKVMEEILSLEENKSSRTPPPEPFKGKHLKGFWKKHFVQTNLMGRNLMNEWKMQSTKSEKLKALAYKNLKITNDPKILSENLARDFVQGYLDREKRSSLDGEWIIFAKYEDRNFYLSIAFHTENDEDIRYRIISECSSQYPFLKAEEV